MAVDDRLTGGRVTSWTGRTGHFIMYGRHPSVLIFFIVLLAGGEFLFLPGAWPRIAPVHRVLGSVAILAPYVFLWLSARSDPGVVTPATHARWMSHYPYDFALFRPGQTCRTCGLLKPARSKHCSVCGRCVHKMDHHCVFINNCVGYGNQHWFLLLLLSTAVLTAYGACLGLALVADSVRARRRLHPGYSLWKPATRPPVRWADWLVLFTMGVQDDVGIGSVTLLSLMTSPLVWGLLAYHVYLIYCGTTTNESMKWQDWRAEMDEGCAFKRGLPPPLPPPPPPPAARAGEKEEEEAQQQQQQPWTRWPVDAIQVLVRTDDGRAPRPTAGPGVGDWERVWKLRDVENLYDLGFWDNLLDVFFPDYNFRGDRPGAPAKGASSSSSPSASPSSSASAVADLERGRKGKGKARKPKVSAAASLVNAAT